MSSVDSNPFHVYIYTIWFPYKKPIGHIQAGEPKYHMETARTQTPLGLGTLIKYFIWIWDHTVKYLNYNKHLIVERWNKFWLWGRDSWLLPIGHTHSDYYCLPNSIYKQKITVPVAIKAETHNYNKQSKQKLTVKLLQIFTLTSITQE